jgi:hypothetical protein
MTTCRVIVLLGATLAIASVRPGLLQHLQVEQEAEAIGICPRTNPNFPNCKPPTDCSVRATTSLQASPMKLRLGESATLQWSVSFSSGCRQATITLDGKRVAARGSIVVTPLVSRSYALMLGSATLAKVSVEVGLPKTVRIEGSTMEWRRLLIRALATPNTLVILAHDVDMDLTGEQNIPIRENVTLMSAAPQVATAGLRAGPLTTTGLGRDARHLGPRLYTRSYPQPLFAIRCDDSGENVRLLGFRLQGPSFGVDGEHEEDALYFYACKKAEVAYMEISGWSGTAVRVRDSDPKNVVPPDGPWIHDNFIHHNQNIGAPGYGLDVEKRGNAIIERNVFDFNRHAITASGTPGTSYTARFNLVLKGGGVHGRPWNRLTQQFDVHGDSDCALENPDIPLEFPGIDIKDWAVRNCGNAGSEFVFANNAFQYTIDRAIKIRGTPTEAAYIYDNVFPHRALSDAVSPLPRGDGSHVIVGSNTIGVDTFGQYGVCDFDGDGKDDLFLPTGASWWYSSGGRMHWTFLAPHTERLHQLGLGDFTGDGRCDVFAVRDRQWVLSDGGTGSWRRIAGSYGDVPFSQLAFGDFNGDRRKDFFRRHPDGQWSTVSPGVYDWRPLARVPDIPLSGLRFGDFDGNGVTDVLSKSGGVWSVSYAGETDWQPLPSRLSDDLSPLLIANVDGNPGDDMVRFVASGRHTARWEISSGGQTSWQTFAEMEWPVLPVHGPLAETVFSFLGNFDTSAGADLLMVDRSRMSRLFRRSERTFRRHGFYAY